MHENAWKNIWIMVIYTKRKRDAAKRDFKNVEHLNMFPGTIRMFIK